MNANVVITIIMLLVVTILLTTALDCSIKILVDYLKEEYLSEHAK